MAATSGFAEINFTDAEINVSDVKMPGSKKRKMMSTDEEEELILTSVPYYTWQKQFNGKIEAGRPCGHVACFVNATVRSKELIPTNGDDLRYQKNLVAISGLEDLITTSFNPGESNREKYTTIPAVPGGQVICNFGIAMSPTMYKQAVSLGKRAAEEAGQKFVDRMGGMPSDPDDPNKTVVLRKMTLDDNMQKLAVCGSLRFHWLRQYLKQVFGKRYCETCVQFGTMNVPCMFVDVEDEKEITQIFTKLGFKVQKAKKYK
ncbi:hypothetical protein CYMTET_45073 [Cymbomonas tetramitiformis]|uniref:Uncharacterized protein n=1 Tax=Cymbomonas tetramitiformis TaxID=36881 RepID=A0AAE0BYY6_9CHLO|nr:hypothetical protein CYMTET_45073 [Cymbomonas tetramitiformis]